MIQAAAQKNFTSKTIEFSKSRPDGKKFLLVEKKGMFFLLVDSLVKKVQFFHKKIY